MKNKVLYKILGLALLVVGAVACDTASQDAEPVISPDGYAVATFENKTGTTVSEGDTLIYEITLDKTIDRAVTFSFRKTGGTCDADDYSVEPAVIQPYTNKANLLIIFHEDYDYAATETLTGTIGAFSIADKYLLNSTTVNPTLTITVNNYVSDLLSISLSWGQEVTVEKIVNVELTAEEYGNEYTVIVKDTVEVTVDVADEVDFDIIVVDIDGNVVDWGGATGDNPEHLNLDLPDGVYTIATDLYKNGLLSYYSIVDAELTMPITTLITRQGTDLIDFEVVQDPSQVPTVDTPGFKDNDEGFGGVVCEIHISGGKYTIVEFDGTQTGPVKGIKFQRPQIHK